jgi:glycerol-3-phosphate acyltransferase PlsY
MAAAGLWFVAGYLVGSVPVGLLVGRLAGIDIRRHGTGNIGASNVYRNVGPLPAAVVGVVSFAQGLGPAWVAWALTGSPLALAAAAVGSVAGYGWSAALAFRGGRAVGTATGALTAIWPPGLAPLLLCYALGGAARMPAPAVLLGLLAFLAALWLGPWPHPAPLLAAAPVVVGLVLVRRLDGVRPDLRADPGRRARIVLDRLVFDRRPGQRLVGPNG